MLGGMVCDPLIKPMIKDAVSGAGRTFLVLLTVSARSHSAKELRCKANEFDRIESAYSVCALVLAWIRGPGQPPGRL